MQDAFFRNTGFFEEALRARYSNLTFFSNSTFEGRRSFEEEHSFRSNRFLRDHSFDIFDEWTKAVGTRTTGSMSKN